ncbi:1,4-dihydroxy-2-naphthoate octaprenyltransferase [Friedmanniella endophytica]|uniref:1,4-dihydroxy-2-naphthoate octaprenyltransferase n=1 Tax=Microlunatus kandeliicorticis TaxID=1759536 RepID=A0A7W3P4D6_9ACTN|nr:1,4-dihydroxy-2-naphthoate polyprenyltransferase [Microlunatus kandeliicorticis]MBA8792762.1 1,4-dihydroxy-2-naphthoate octaprenyltransferase [Microlunatus kandeliicorticis]
MSTTGTPTAAQWLAGARPRIWPIAIAPVVVGTGLAGLEGGLRPLLAVLALVVSLALDIGVNYANDYSDGIRGTDADRVGPMRLVGSGIARPAAVKRAAFLAFGVAAVAGLAAVVLSGLWWLLLVGAASVLAAWYYTGGRRPYGYLGLGEVFVFVFFGLVAVCGTVLIQTGRITGVTVLGAVQAGLLATAALVANNLRDIPGDQVAGKRTLATRLGDRGTRTFYVGLQLGAAVLVVLIAALSGAWWALLGLAGPLAAGRAIRLVLRGALGRELIPVLKDTSLAMLIGAVGLAAGLLIG